MPAKSFASSTPSGSARTLKVGAKVLGSGEGEAHPGYADPHLGGNMKGPGDVHSLPGQRKGFHGSEAAAASGESRPRGGGHVVSRTTTGRPPGVTYRFSSDDERRQRPPGGVRGHRRRFGTAAEALPEAAAASGDRWAGRWLANGGQGGLTTRPHGPRTASRSCTPAASARSAMIVLQNKIIADWSPAAG